MKIGDLVTRNSYHNDIVFVITDIVEDMAYLKGNDIRLVADAPLSDLVLSDARDDFNPNVEELKVDRDEYFYLPGKILHLDTDNILSKSLKNPENIKKQFLVIYKISKIVKNKQFFIFYMHSIQEADISLSN